MPNTSDLAKVALDALKNKIYNGLTPRHTLERPNPEVRVHAGDASHIPPVDDPSNTLIQLHQLLIWATSLKPLVAGDESVLGGRDAQLEELKLVVQKEVLELFKQNKESLLSIAVSNDAASSAAYIDLALSAQALLFIEYNESRAAALQRFQLYDTITSKKNNHLEPKSEAARLARSHQLAQELLLRNDPNSVGTTRRNLSVAARAGLFIYNQYFLLIGSVNAAMNSGQVLEENSRLRASVVQSIRNIKNDFSCLSSQIPRIVNPIIMKCDRLLLALQLADFMRELQKMRAERMDNSTWSNRFYNSFYNRFGRNQENDIGNKGDRLSSRLAQYDLIINALCSAIVMLQNDAGPRRVDISTIKNELNEKYKELLGADVDHPGMLVKIDSHGASLADTKSRLYQKLSEQKQILDKAVDQLPVPQADPSHHNAAPESPQRVLERKQTKQLAQAEAAMETKIFLSNLEERKLPGQVIRFHNELKRTLYHYMNASSAEKLIGSAAFKTKYDMLFSLAASVAAQIPVPFVQSLLSEAVNLARGAAQEAAAGAARNAQDVVSSSSEADKFVGLIANIVTFMYQQQLKLFSENQDDKNIDILADQFAQTLYERLAVCVSGGDASANIAALLGSLQWSASALNADICLATSRDGVSGGRMSDKDKASDIVAKPGLYWVQRKPDGEEILAFYWSDDCDPARFGFHRVDGIASVRAQAMGEQPRMYAVPCNDGPHKVQYNHVQMGVKSLTSHDSKQIEEQVADIVAYREQIRHKAVEMCGQVNSPAAAAGATRRPGVTSDHILRWGLSNQLGKCQAIVEHLIRKHRAASSSTSAPAMFAINPPIPAFLNSVKSYLTDFGGQSDLQILQQITSMLMKFDNALSSRSESLERIVSSFDAEFGRIKQSVLEVGQNDEFGYVV